MNDKVITTFETTITWYDPNDKRPHEDGYYNVLCKSDCGVWIATYDSENNSYQLINDSSGDIQDIQWWAYLPEFE